MGERPADEEKSPFDARERSLSTLSFNPARTSAALLIFASLLWGTGGLAGALLSAAAGGLGPISVAAYRLLIGGLLATVIVVGAARQLLRGRAALIQLLVFGALLAEFQAAYQVAVAQISVSLATLITIGCVPVFVAAATAWQERRWPASRTLVAIAGAVAGLALLSGTPVAGADGWRTVTGVTMSLAAGAGFAVLTLISARPGGGQYVFTAVGLLLGGILLLPVALVGGMAIPLTGEVLGLVLYVGFVPTALAYGAYALGLRHAHPVAAALAVMLEPITATGLSILFHGERLSPAGIVGATLIAGALTLYYLPAAAD